ncbi:hypothetical protein ACQFYA_01825 [Promicromonospora sp. Marseille-Q5078]
MILDVELAPLTGSPAALGDAAADATRAAARLADARTQLLRVRATLDGQRSTAVDQARDRVTTLADDARASAGMLDAAAATLRRHVGVLGDAQLAADRALADHAEAVARERRWQVEADEARRSTWNDAALGTALGTAALGTTTHGGLTGRLTGGPGHAHLRLASAEREVAAARADALAAEARWRAARDAKAAGSRHAAAALASLADVRAVRVATAAGVGAAGLQASGAAARRAVALLPRAASAEDAATRRAVREDVRRTLTEHADDPAFWAVFWDATTPAQLAAAVVAPPASRLGPVAGVFEGATGGTIDDELARALGNGVRLWAETATPAEQRELGRGVVEDVARTAGSPLSPVGGPGAAAALLPASLPAPVHAGAADALDAWWGDRAFGDGSLTAMAPVVVAVAGGLAAHRTLAFDRLAPADGGRVARSAAHWLGTAPRDGWPDGGRAVARAFGAAVDTGSTSADPADQARAALLVSHATQQLPDGLLASPGLAEDAARDVALAYEPYLPSMGDAAVVQGVVGTPAPPPGVDEDLPFVRTSGLPQPTVQPALDAFALRDVIEATSRTPAAADVWLGAADRYTESLVVLATSDAHDAGTYPRGTFISEALRDVGAVAGAIQAPTISAAHGQVQTREALLSLTGPGLGVASIGRSMAESAAVTVGSTALSFVSTDAPLVEANARVRATGDELNALYTARLHDSIVAHDVAHGVPEHEALRRMEDGDPDDGANLTGNDFRETYAVMSQTPDTEDRR